MAWTSITAAQVRGRLVAAEASALASLLPSGSTDPLPDIISEVTDEVRGYISAGGYTLGAAGTLPSRLVSTAVAMIRYRLCTRLPIKSLLTEERVNENKEAVRRLEAVAAGRFAIEEATTADSETAGGAGPSVEGKTLTFDRESQDGI